MQTEFFDIIEIIGWLDWYYPGTSTRQKKAQKFWCEIENGCLVALETKVHHVSLLSALIENIQEQDITPISKPRVEGGIQTHLDHADFISEQNLTQHESFLQKN